MVKRVSVKTLRKRGRRARYVARQVARLRSKEEYRNSRRAMRRIAQEVVSRNLTDHEVRNSSEQNLYSFPGVAGGSTLPTLWSANNVFDTSVVWTGINQGGGEGARLANRLKIKKFRFSFIINPSSNLLTAHMVRMYVVTYKFDPNGATNNDIWAACQNWSSTGTVNRTFFDNGNSTNGMTGSMQDLLMPINTDAFTVHKVKTFKLGYASVPDDGSAATTISGNNDFKYIIRGSVNVGKYMPKYLKYNDNSTVSYNKKVFIIFEVLSADGASNDDIAVRGKIWYNYNFVFESA